MNRIILQMGQNAPSLGLALKMASAEQIETALLLADQSCQNHSSWARIQAWLSNTWAELYGFSTAEEESFDMPAATFELTIDIHDLPPQRSLDFAVEIPLKKADIIDVRTGTKMMSITLTNHGLDKGNPILYSDPWRGGLLDLQTGEIRSGAQHHLDIREVLCLAHEGPVFGMDAAPFVLKDDNTGIVSLGDIMRDCDAATLSNTRPKFQNRICEALGLGRAPMVTVDRSSPHYKFLTNIERNHWADGMETLVAGICMTTLDGQWLQNVKFLDATAKMRIERLNNSLGGHRYKAYQLRKIRDRKQVVDFHTWLKNNPNPSYDPSTFHDPELVGGFKHELDVLGYHRGRLYYLSVKDLWLSNAYGESNLIKELNEMVARRNQLLQAQACESILVSGMPVSDELMEYAHGLGLHLCFVLDLPELLRNLTESD